ncbi:hypothetical protein RSJ2_3943 (plasmid) [Clostridium botulinum]|uniref:hypothetical protein n=2 Tax=Clostridium botulinum TaxID=1491 RepID=UPI000464754F|nr:hypothetical protein [Clostridium botulinum]APR02392.1 hypothetical protein RSJ2_3943 [Clostridium botulinum]AUN01471.1 hypothetical protein RSJ19_00370 [Clostridium botulinum]
MIDNYIFFIVKNRYGDVCTVDKWNKNNYKEFEKHKSNLIENNLYIREITWSEYLIFKECENKKHGIKYAYYLLGYEEVIYFNNIKSYDEYISCE